MHENLKFNIEHEISSMRWFQVNDHLIVMPPNPPSDHSDRVLTRTGAAALDHAPSPSELDNYSSIIVLENGTSEPGDDLRVQSLWRGNSGGENMGALFPTLRPVINHFQTLQGLLYPSTVELSQERLSNRSPEVTEWLRAVTPQRVWCLSNLLSPRKQAKSLEALLRPETNTHRLGIWGIGDIGTIVASHIRELDIADSHISEIYIGGSRESKKVETQVMELRDINLEGVHQPVVHGILPGEESRFFRECDMILIIAASDVPTPDRKDIDVRMAQFESNSKLLENFIMSAALTEYDGQILIGSDPVEQLTMKLYLEMKKREIDVNTHQLVGYGGMINRSRAKAMADEQGITSFQESGRTFGPHGNLVLAFPTHNPEQYDAKQAERLSFLTGHRNYYARERGSKPHVGPAVLIAHGIKEMNSGGIIYASPFLPSNKVGHNGSFFGTRVQYDPFPGSWKPKVEQPFLSQIMAVLDFTHEWVEQTSYFPQAMQNDPFSFTRNPEDHPAFHPYVMERWFELFADKINNDK